MVGRDLRPPSPSRGLALRLARLLCVFPDPGPDFGCFRLVRPVAVGAGECISDGERVEIFSGGCYLYLK